MGTVCPNRQRPRGGGATWSAKTYPGPGVPSCRQRAAPVFADGAGVRQRCQAISAAEQVASRRRKRPATIGGGDGSSGMVCRMEASGADCAVGRLPSATTGMDRAVRLSASRKERRLAVWRRSAVGAVGSYTRVVSSAVTRASSEAFLSAFMALRSCLLMPPPRRPVGAAAAGAVEVGSGCAVTRRGDRALARAAAARSSRDPLSRAGVRGVRAVGDPWVRVRSGDRERGARGEPGGVPASASSPRGWE